MNVLFLPQTCALGPSSRYRVYQLLPRLEQLGIHTEVSPALAADLYARLYLRPRPTASRAAAWRAVWRQRRADLRRAGKFDAVFIQKGFFPGLFAGLECQFAAQRPLLFDLDDAIWLPRQGGSRLLRALHRESTVQDILCRAAAVIAGNEFLAAYARRFSRNVIVVPSTIDTARYPAGNNSAVIGWIGSRTTLPYLQPLRPVFATLGVTPRVIASGDPAMLEFPVEFRPWQLDTELAELSQIGIGIAPLPDTPWEQGKCGVKLLQYLACGIPVVASPVGVHRDIVRPGVNGFFAATTAEWISHLRALRDDPALRRQLGQAGRAFVRERYDLHHAAEIIATTLRTAVE